MRFFDIRARMLLAALLPVTLVAFLLAAVFLLGRVTDLDDAYNQRSRSLARQVASASEYGMFASNTVSLQTVAVGALREPDVRSVVILNVQGHVMAKAGQVGYAGLLAQGEKESAWNDAATRHDLLVQPVMATVVKLDDPFYSAASIGGDASQLLGHVVIEMSRQTVQAHERDMLLAGLAVTLGGLLLGGFLAVRIGRGVIHPILRVSGMIRRIGRGDLSAREEVRPDDPLRDLQVGLNLMAERLELGRDELEQRVAQATRELREKKEEAESATLAKSRFLAAASHDLRQPTHALGMFVSRLAQLPHDAETQHLVLNLEASVRAMQDLLDALLDMSRLEAQTVQVSPRSFPMTELLSKLSSSLMPVAIEKGLKFRVRPSSAWVMSDPVLLHRMLLNLVNNALRYTRAGAVLLACRKVHGGSHVRIEVWDSGIGIAPEHQQDIFKEFYQVGNPERDRNKGLGLGLSIVERTASLLGHSLQLRSRLGQGTRFSIEVPAARPDAHVAHAAAIEPVAIDDLAARVVLVIEDDRLAAQALSGLLASWGCQVVEVDGLDGALARFAQGLAPDVIISDYRLRAGENGIETVARLRAVAGRHISACLMSGDTQADVMQMARQNGLTLLHKPVRPAKLRSLIRRLCQDKTAEPLAAQNDGEDLP